jgi:plasmid stabilization system protein ParE
MAKILPVFWSPAAQTKYNAILLQIISNWTINEAIEFDKKTMNLIETLSSQHKLCPKAKQINVRKCVITSQTSLVYRITKANIELVNFIDNRSEHQY